MKIKTYWKAIAAGLSIMFILSVAMPTIDAEHESKETKAERLMNSKGCHNLYCGRNSQ